MGTADNTKELEDGIAEWEATATGAAGSQPTAAPVAARVAEFRPGFRSKRRTGTPESLEEAIRSVMDEDELDDQPVRYAAAAEHAHR
jgi:hypothetical protein